MKIIPPFPLLLLIFLVSSDSAFAGASGKSRHRPLTHYEQDSETAGDITQLAIPLSGLIYSSIIEDWEGAKQLAFSYTSTAAATQALKYTIREERPNQPEGAKGTSFPSGHTSSAFAGAAYWQTRYGWEIGAPMYGAAAFVGYSRVRARKHNWSDVIAGAALGIGVNYVFVTEYAKDPIQLSLELEYDMPVLKLAFTF